MPVTDQSNRERVEIVEVGPRDGFQSIALPIPTPTKLALMDTLRRSGVRRMEVGSFVSPTVLPQMADVRTILSAVKDWPQLKPAVLVPNLRGAELALEAGAQHLVTVVSATESHNQANTRRSIRDSLDELRIILGLAPHGGILRYSVAMSFHCPFEGPVGAGQVISIIENALSIRQDIEIGLADTTGNAMPHEVAALFRSCMERFPGCKWAFHGHDTYGFGIANVLAAYAVGVRIFDAAVAGIGGCPFAPGASGNVATEDVVYTFDRQGVLTDIDLAEFLSAANRAAALPGAVPSGHVRGAVRSAS
jgi:hydroxymethylglutaryl-CoA lyase